MGTNYNLIIGHDELVQRWVGNELGVDDWLYPVAGIGVIRENDMTPVAGVVYYAYRWPAIEMACASIDRRWLNRKLLNVFFDYPFNVLKCKRICSLVDEDNYHALKFNEKLGFTREALLEDAHPNGHAVLLRMLKAECRWIDGQQKLKNKNRNAERERNGTSAISIEFRRHICERFSESV